MNLTNCIYPSPGWIEEDVIATKTQGSRTNYPENVFKHPHNWTSLESLLWLIRFIFFLLFCGTTTATMGEVDTIFHLELQFLKDKISPSPWCCFRSFEKLAMLTRMTRMFLVLNSSKWLSRNCAERRRQWDEKWFEGGGIFTLRQNVQ